MRSTATGGVDGNPNTFAGLLPTAGRPNRSCLRLVLTRSELAIWYTGLLRLPESHRGLPPHKFTPMTGVPNRCTRSAVRVQFEFHDAGLHPVIAIR
jgi:hypothetical protein